MTVQKAINTIQRDYHKDVHSWGDDFIAEIKNGEYDDREAFLEAFDERIDSAARVIYTQQAMLAVVASSNDEAAWDEGIELDWSEGIPWSQLAFFAFRRDILEYLLDQEIDVDDDETFESDEDED